MANEIRNLAQTQRQATEALSRLTEQLRASSIRGADPGSRLSEARTGIEADEDSANRRALNEVVGALRDVSTGLTAGTSALSRTLAGATSALSALGRGLGGGPGSPGGLLKSGFGLAPLAAAIVGLFGGGRKEEPPVFESFREPPPIRIEAANGALRRSSYAEQRSPRTREEQAPAGASVVVNIQAMDARSFLDRSNDIAAAVKDAMLHMHPVNDVISEL